MTSKEIASIVITKSDGKELQISRICNRIAYDQDNNPISDRSFRYNPTLLDINWIRPKELVFN